MPGKAPAAARPAGKTGPAVAVPTGAGLSLVPPAGGAEFSAGTKAAVGRKLKALKPGELWNELLIKHRRASQEKNTRVIQIIEDQLAYLKTIIQKGD
jgi:hypothetical protein